MKPINQSKRVSHGLSPGHCLFIGEMNTWTGSLSLQLATGLARVAQVFPVSNKEPKAGPTVIFCS